MRGPKGFPRGAKSGEIYFSVTKLRKELVFGKNVIKKCQISKSKGLGSPTAPFRRPYPYFIPKGYNF